MHLMNTLLLQAANPPLPDPQAGATPSSLRIWVFYLIVAGIGFLFCRVRFWMLPVVWMFEGAITLGMLSTLRDPVMRAAIAARSPNFLPQAFIAIALGFLIPLLGAYQSWRTRDQTHL